jgi:glycosyltransferase involved in cell wall biosynthesis
MRFTVLTPTYNRAHTLGRVYEALCAQTFRDFEWVIVDDGSSDGTNELVASWESSFPIRYFWKPNGGMCTALNLGIRQAEAEFVLQLDDDDDCTPNALERFDYHWRQIPDPSRFANLSCLCKTPQGEIVGKPYPADYVDAWTFADQLRFRSSERWGINRTDILRQFPFPEDERYVSTALVWNRISRKYAARFFNEALRVYEPGAAGITKNSVVLRASSPKATLTFYREVAFSPAPMPQRLRAAINFCRFAAIAGAQKCGIRLYLPKKVKD